MTKVNTEALTAQLKFVSKVFSPLFDDSHCFMISMTGGKVKITGANPSLALVGVVEGDGNDEAHVMVHGNRLTALLALIKEDTVTLAKNDRAQLEVAWSNGTAKLRGLANPMRSIHPGKTKQTFACPVKALSTALSAVQLREFEKSALALLEVGDAGVRLVVVNNVILAISDTLGENQPACSAALSKNGLDILASMVKTTATEHCQIGVHEHSVSFDTGDRYACAAQPSAAFPNFRRLLESSHSVRIEMDAPSLCDAVSRITAGHEVLDFARLTMRTTTDGVSVSVDNSAENLSALYTGDELALAFIASQFKSVANAIDTPRLVVTAPESLRPVQVAPLSDQYIRYLISPVRV